jgi:hypothetical protein
MADDNIAEFNRMVARVVGLLYEAHPRALDLSLDEVLPRTERMWTGPEGEAVSGMLQWLSRNRIVAGTYQPSRPASRMLN